MVVAGKGGVGRSTLSATVAGLAARHGLSVLVVELEETSRPVRALHRDVPTPVEGGEPSAQGLEDGGSSSAPIHVRTLTPDDVLVDYLTDHGFGRVARRLAKSGMIDVAATGIPGVRDVLVLGKIVQLERARAADLIVVDGPAAGHAATFLTSARGLLDFARVGPLHALAADVVEFLTDPVRCEVVLVTLPEETPVNETVGTARTLRSRVGTHLGPVIVNRMFPRLDDLDVDPEAAAAAAGVNLAPGEADAMRAAAAFRRRRQDGQAEQATRLAETLDLPQLWLPQLFSSAIGPPEIARLVDALEIALRHQREPCRVGWAGLTTLTAGIAPRRSAAGLGSSV